MTIILILTETVAQDLRGDAPSSPASEMILGTVNRFDGSIAPTHPGVDDPKLAAFFTVDVQVSDADLVAETLRDLEGVEASYVKPPDALP